MANSISTKTCFKNHICGLEHETMRSICKMIRRRYKVYKLKENSQQIPASYTIEQMADFVLPECMSPSYAGLVANVMDHLASCNILEKSHSGYYNTKKD